ncbi:MAG: hypothetical protein QT10_C0002G0034 [archaeon GW2011_AR19]|nr:MAG: hypothetical protein QT10_C0002G0034 [archaeon GW2011_AR19]
MLHMIQKCSSIKVAGIFFEEPTEIHFIREISKKINLAPTSVKKHLSEFEKESFIIKQKSKPFDGYVSNRENPDFIFYKRLYNLAGLRELKDYLERKFSPKLVVVFGSYSTGEDIESSDIDLLIATKGKKNFDFKKFEKSLKREINPIIVDDLNKLEQPLKNQIYNGVALLGGF